MTMNRENKNIVSTISIDILTGLATLLSAGALWQGLLLHYGLSSAEVGVLTSAASIVQAIAMFLNIYITDRVRSPIRTMLWCNLPVLLFFVLMTVLCFVGQTAFNFPLLMGAVIVFNFFEGLRGIITYKIPFLVYRMEKYGRITAITGVLINVFTTLASIGIPVLLSVWDYDRGMQRLFACSVLAIIGRIILNAILKPLSDTPVDLTSDAAKAPLATLLKEKSIRALFLPNFVRGISMGYRRQHCPDCRPRLYPGQQRIGHAGQCRPRSFHSGQCHFHGSVKRKNGQDPVSSLQCRTVRFLRRADHPRKLDLVFGHLSAALYLL